MWFVKLSEISGKLLFGTITRVGASGGGIGCLAALAGIFLMWLGIRVVYPFNEILGIIISLIGFALSFYFIAVAAILALIVIVLLMLICDPESITNPNKTEIDYDREKIMADSFANDMSNVIFADNFDTITDVFNCDCCVRDTVQSYLSIEGLPRYCTLDFGDLMLRDFMLEADVRIPENAKPDNITISFWKNHWEFGKFDKKNFSYRLTIGGKGYGLMQSFDKDIYVAGAKFKGLGQLNQYWRKIRLICTQSVISFYINDKFIFRINNGQQVYKGFPIHRGNLSISVSRGILEIDNLVISTAP